MRKPLVIAYHLVWTSYGWWLHGWWLPNDPRGSGSKIVRSPAIAKVGKLHYGRKAHQPSAREVSRLHRSQLFNRHRRAQLHVLRLRDHTRPRALGDSQA